MVLCTLLVVLIEVIPTGTVVALMFTCGCIIYDVYVIMIQLEIQSKQTSDEYASYTHFELFEHGLNRR